MTVNLEQLLRDCTVFITDSQGRPSGSGFFIAPGAILTAAHVVHQAQGKPLVRWRGTELELLAVEWQEPPGYGGTGPWQLPDMALLKLSGPGAEGHPCVLLADRLPGSKLLAEGYTRGISGGYAPDSVRLRFEAIRPDSGFAVIKCTNSIIDDGMSGGPLLDLESGAVVGVVKAQRAGYLPLGGVAVGIAYLRDRQQDLWTANSLFHHTDRRWEFARLNPSTVSDPVEATCMFLRSVQQVIAKRPAILPSGAQMADIHQMPSVRALARGRGKEANESLNRSFDEIGEGAIQFDGVFQWAPMRVRWRAIVLCGMPGLGKSWLLNAHANAIAAEGLARLDEAGSDPASVSIPLIVDCAVLGNLLPSRVTRENVLRALIQAMEAETDEDSVAIPAEAIIRLAYDDGRLVSCLDALDEVGVADRQKVRQALPILAERGNQLLVTSRPSDALRTDTAALGGCFTAEVMGFSPGQVFSFARAWFSDVPSRGLEVETDLLDRDELRRLARIPLLAAFLCQLASEGDEVQALPSTRVGVFQSVVLGALSGRWRDPSQQAVDPDIPPDPALRLRVLSDAVSQLSRKWRSRVDRFSRSELAAALRGHPDYARAAAEAEARWFVWHTLRSPTGGQPSSQADPLLWEYMFDGLLAHDLNEANESMVRFVHPVLAEYCVASYTASQNDADLKAVVDSHRWFDVSWQEVWPLTAGLMQEPGKLVELFLSCQQDSWFEQTFLASRCVAGAGSRIDRELRARLVSRVVKAAASWRSFDRDRALLHLAELVHARTEEAIRAARFLLENPDTVLSTRLRTAALLGEIGDQAGLKVARSSLGNRGIPAMYRAWCARAVVVSDDAEGLVTLLVAIKGARTLGELSTLVNAVPVESRVGGDLAAQILRDQGVHTTIRATVGSALIRTGDRHRIQLAKELASTPLTIWTLRSSLIATLLAVGEDDALPLGLEMFDDPNLSAGERVNLVEALIRRGEISVLPRAVQMLGRDYVDWQDRRRLARAMADLGQPGIDELTQQVHSALRIDLKMRHIIALVEVGECIDLAADLVTDPGAPALIRIRVATGLLERGYLSLPVEVLKDLATDPQSHDSFQDELIIAMVSRDIPGAAEAAGAFLIQSATAIFEYSGNNGFISDLMALGPEGHSVLTRIVQNEQIAEPDRALAIVAVADATPAEAAEYALSLEEYFSSFTNTRITALLVDKGVTELADRVTEFLRDHDEVYRTLFRLMSSPRASLALVERFLSVGDDATKADAPEPSPTIAINAGFLEAAGLTWSSEVEQQSICQWIEEQLRIRVGTKLSAFLTTDQIDEFVELDSTEQQIEFLSARAAWDSELVRNEVSALQEELRGNPSIVRHSNALDNQPTLRKIAYIASALSEWIAITRTHGGQASANFLRSNKQVLINETSYNLLGFAATMTSGWFPHEGHQFLVGLALHDGLQTACDAMTDSSNMCDLLRVYLNEGRGADLFYGALGGLATEPESEVVFFYGAIGAAMIEKWKLSIELMKLSGERADEDQRQQGLNTLERQVLRFEWDEEFVAELRAALSGSTRQASE